MIDHFNVNFFSIIFVIRTDLLYIFCFVLLSNDYNKIYCVKNLMDVYDLCHTYEFMSKMSSLL